MTAQTPSHFLKRAVVVTSTPVTLDDARAWHEALEADETLILSSADADDWIEGAIKFSGREPRHVKPETLAQHVMRAVQHRLGFLKKQSGHGDQVKPHSLKFMAQRIEALRPDVVRWEGQEWLGLPTSIKPTPR